MNKITCHDWASFNVIKKRFGELCEPLKYVFNLSIVNGIFPDDQKIATGTPIYKANNSSNVSNYRAISVLPCFSKMLEQVILPLAILQVMPLNSWLIKFTRLSRKMNIL